MSLTPANLPDDLSAAVDTAIEASDRLSIAAKTLDRAASSTLLTSRLFESSLESAHNSHEITRRANLIRQPIEDAHERVVDAALRLENALQILDSAQGEDP